MKLRKTLVTILAVLMVFTSLQITAFAEENKYPNFTGEVWLDNLNCKEIESFEELKDLPLTITITNDADPTLTTSIVMEYDEIVGYYAAGNYEPSAQRTDIIADLMKNQEGVLDAWLKDEITDEEFYAAVFKGYTITLNLGDNSHFTTELYDGGVWTSEDVIMDFEFILWLNGPEGGFPEGQAPETYMELMDYLVGELTEGAFTSYEDALRAEGYTEEKIAEYLLQIEILDEALAEARAGVFGGQLFIVFNLLCDCPNPQYYEIAHAYMLEKDGKLELIDMVYEGEADEFGDYYVLGEGGDIVSAEDWMKPVYTGSVADYTGKTFEYEGSWDSWVLYDEEITDYTEWELEDFVLGKDPVEGLVLVYVIGEEDLVTPADPVDPAEPADPEGDEPIADPVVDKKDSVEEKTEPADKDTATTETAPVTGDRAPIGLYIALLGAAIAVVVVLFVLKKKNNQE